MDLHSECDSLGYFWELGRLTLVGPTWHVGEDAKIDTRYEEAFKHIMYYDAHARFGKISLLKVPGSENCGAVDVYL